MEQGVNIRVVQQVLGHTRDHHRAIHPRLHTPDTRCRGAARLRALGKSPAVASLRLRRSQRSKRPSPKIWERALRLRRIGDLNPGWAVNPNRISSSELGLGSPGRWSLRSPWERSVFLGGGVTQQKK
ncbi:hypothetical protein [Nonomuraea sp. NPDC049400]|uniref:hypothetical protein n=1 Tax=Nonomuraea sp. NPDC049400 TaxID=3364352 RepID=UPI003794C7C5